MFSEQAPILESSFTEYLESAENCELTVGGEFPGYNYRREIVQQLSILKAIRGSYGAPRPFCVRGIARKTIGLIKLSECPFYVV
jgi:hypothetical protein